MKIGASFIDLLAGGMCIQAAAFLPAEGERAKMLAVEWVELPVSDADRPFESSLPGVDFTGLQVTGEFEISYYSVSDSVFCEQRPDSRREYRVAGDSVCLLSTE